MEKNTKKDRINLKKFINDKKSIIPTLVREIKIRKSKKHPTIRSLLPSNCLYLPPKSRKVSIMVGESGGHDPAPLSYVSPHCLNTAIVGGIFSIPPVSDVVNAIFHTGMDSNGILVLAKNYQGNDLSFGLAIMRVKSACADFWLDRGNIPLEIIKIADDCAFIDFRASDEFGYLGESWRKKARGLAGAVYVYKVLGYWSEAWVEDETAVMRYKKQRGYSEETAEEESGEEKAEGVFNHLQELKVLAEDMMKEGGLITLGCCLSRSSNFNAQEIHQHISFGEVEIGVGIHFGAGKDKIEYQNAEQVVSLMVRKIKNTVEATNPTGIIKKRYALMINNLGSATDLEMAVISELSRYYFKMYGFNIDFLSVGKFMTALDTNGFSLTVLELKENIRDLLVEALMKETDTPFDMQECKEDNIEDDDSGSDDDNDTFKRLDLTICNGIECKVPFDEKVGKILEGVTTILRQNEYYLEQLDRKTGDGDLGECIAKAMKEIYPYIEYIVDEEKTLAQGLYEFGDLISQNIQGSSGSLYGAFIFGVAEALSQAEKIDEGVLRLALRAGNLKLKELGKAEFDERTMLYVLNKVEENWNFDEFNAEKILQFEEDVKKYCDEVRQILPTKGMSLFRGEACIGFEDPGCEMVRIWIVELARLVYKEYFSN